MVSALWLDVYNQDMESAVDYCMILRSVYMKTSVSMLMARADEAVCCALCPIARGNRLDGSR